MSRGPRNSKGMTIMTGTRLLMMSGLALAGVAAGTAGAQAARCTPATSEAGFDLVIQVQGQEGDYRLACIEGELTAVPLGAGSTTAEIAAPRPDAGIKAAGSDAQGEAAQVPAEPALGATPQAGAAVAEAPATGESGTNDGATVAEQMQTAAGADGTRGTTKPGMPAAEAASPVAPGVDATAPTDQGNAGTSAEPAPPAESAEVAGTAPLPPTEAAAATAPAEPAPGAVAETLSATTEQGEPPQVAAESAMGSTPAEGEASASPTAAGEPTPAAAGATVAEQLQTPAPENDAESGAPETTEAAPATGTQEQPAIEPDAGDKAPVAAEAAAPEGAARVTGAPKNGKRIEGETAANAGSDMVPVPVAALTAARLAVPEARFASVAVSGEGETEVYGLTGATDEGDAVRVDVESDGRIVQIDREIAADAVPQRVTRIADALLAGFDVERVTLSIRDNYRGYYVFCGTDDRQQRFELEIRSDGRDVRFDR